MKVCTGVDRNEGCESAQVRGKWKRIEAEAFYGLPFAEAMFRAQRVHRDNFDPNHVETASLLSIKTGGLPGRLRLSRRARTTRAWVKATRLMDRPEVVATAPRAKEAGATRFCMAAAWRSPKDRNLDRVCEMVRAVKNLDLETCVTRGMLTPKQAVLLSDAGLDFYNHNIDTSPDFYGRFITTRTLQDQIDTLEHVRQAGIKICCGGIVGMGKRAEDRLELLVLLANLPKPPEGLLINLWNEVKRVPVIGSAEAPDPIALVRLIATARIMMPKSVIRLSAGRRDITDEWHALSFLAGANSIFIGDVLLTTKNPKPSGTPSRCPGSTSHPPLAGPNRQQARFADMRIRLKKCKFPC
ncbi:biotin synthase BioB [Bradyrhizobium sp. CCGB20]|uniref:biotin synthase BioB n=1 Tax=Bradyrhizobium sp. CCGB20 TaxID=2949633 RepID=UPI0020B1B382|nr:biotin synthase BioB [Bradyrhizobium sp. CCGB20]MCP3396942.1 biotin synthase BioB [Bradyrhizobium sp. CCGB20]